MQGINWLHLTDLHQGMKEQDWLLPNIKERFFEDLSKLHDKAGPWDLVLFTGDLTQRGKEDEFNKLDEFLNELWEHFKKLGSEPQLLAVPGNHDLLRPNLDETTVKLLQEWQNDPNKRQDEFWEKYDSPLREIVWNAFRNFTTWWENQPHKAQNTVPGLLPGDFSFSYEKNGAKIGFIGFNSSFLQLSSGDYEGKLALHPMQFQAVCGGDGPAWTKQHHTCLLMTHHPTNWLNPISQEDLRGEITDHGRFSVHLCGHLHEVSYQESAEGGTQLQRMWRGRSLFGLEHFHKQSQRVERSHGYALGCMQLSDHKGQLIFWPRTIHKQGNERNLGPDQSLRLTEQNHMEPIEFDLLRPYENMYSEFAPSSAETLPEQSILRESNQLTQINVQDNSVYRQLEPELENVEIVPKRILRREAFRGCLLTGIGSLIVIALFWYEVLNLNTSLWILIPIQFLWFLPFVYYKESMCRYYYALKIRDNSIFIGNGQLINDEQNGNYRIFKPTADCFYPSCNGGKIIITEAPPREALRLGKTKLVGICSSKAGQDHSYHLDYNLVATREKLDWGPLDKK